MNEKLRYSTKQTVYVAVFVALTAVLSQISVPLPGGVPVTLQTLAIAFAGYFLGRKFGLYSALIYLLAGLIGLPVFANFTGGVGKFAGPTGGFLIGFLPMVILCGVGNKSRLSAIVFGVLGVICCHLIGAVQYSLVASVPFARAMLLVSVPFLPKDVISTVAAYMLAVAVKSRMPAVSRTVSEPARNSFLSGKTFDGLSFKAFKSER